MRDEPFNSPNRRWSGHGWLWRFVPRSRDRRLTDISDLSPYLLRDIGLYRDETDFAPGRNH